MNSTYYGIEAFVNESPVGNRTVLEETEARRIARLIYDDLCLKRNNSSHVVRVVVYPIINFSPQNVIVTIDSENA